MTKPHKITKLYAWIIQHDDGDDGIPAFRTALGAMPMIGSDKERIESLRPLAEKTAVDHGRPIKLVEFTNMNVLEEYEGAKH